MSRFLLWVLGMSTMLFSVAQETSREEVIQRTRRMEKLWETNPKAAMDSMRTIARMEREREARERLKRYESNNRKDTLEIIDLSDMGLSEIPDWVFQATSLKRLRINNNSIHKIPRELSDLDSLKRIYWGGTTFQKRPKIEKLEQLEFLSMGNNHFRWRRRYILFGEKQPLLPGFKKLTNLESLILTNDEIGKVPIAQIAKIESLKSLDLSRNPIKTVPEKWEKLVSLKELRISNADLKTIDASMYELSNLDELLLIENQIETIPEGISKLKKLRKISFYKNQLEEIPTDFFDLPELLAVDLYYNKLERIPNSIGKAEKLQVLYLSHNKLYDLPEEVGNLIHLEELYLHHNRFSVLPTSLSKLKGLRVLRVNNNYLTEFPSFILDLKNLTDLDLNDNSIRSIPSEIGDFKNLRLFTFERNQIDFEDGDNQSFLRSVYSLHQRGVVCKPYVDMEYIDEEGGSVEF